MKDGRKYGRKSKVVSIKGEKDGRQRKKGWKEGWKKGRKERKKKEINK